MDQPDKNLSRLRALRQVLASRDVERLRGLLAEAPGPADLSALEAVDLLERACAFGPRAAAQLVWEHVRGDFAYTGWALALALRCAQGDVARWLLKDERQDLLGGVRRPASARGLLPHEATFTRFALTRESPTLFVNNMDPTVSTEVFEDFTGTEQLAGAPWRAAVSLERTCELVLQLAREGLLDPVVFDDLLRACLVKAWHALRHAGRHQPEAARTCLGLARELLRLHRDCGMGDANVELIMGNLIVPKASPAIVAFVCQEEPSVFLGRLRALPWLQDDVELLRAMVPRLSPADARGNEALLMALARHGLIDELATIAAWPDTFTPRSLPSAVQVASSAGHAEVAAWLLARLEGLGRTGATARADEDPRVRTKAPAARTNVSDGVAPSATPHREEGAQGVAPSDKTAAAGADLEADALARQILDLARCEVVARNPFLASSLSLLTPVEDHESSSLFRVDGRSLLYDVERMMGDFVEHRRAPTHDLVHALAHCLLLHPFVGGSLRRRHWDLAADIAAEAVVAELMGPRDGLRGSREQAAFDQLGAVLAGRLGAERIYRALGEGRFENDVEQWERLFVSDDHGTWYPEPQDVPADDGKGDEDGPRQGERPGRTSNPDEGEGPSEGPGAARDDDQAPDLPEAYDDAPHDGPPPASGDAKAACEDACAQERWAKAAKSLRVDLETLSRSYGSQTQGLVRELGVSTHEQVDYREFLRQFAVSSEEMHLSDSEFDYVFYTYGLQLYGDTPLIEPLEYKDERRIRDFAIVIDTSSSVTATVVQQFVDATFDVLTSASSFFERTNIHIIQADARVQGDTKICSLADLDRWRQSIHLKGFGGTDFRPAFRYVRELRERGEFDDFQGLIYFTDGWGIYPEQMPPYKTTFVFYDEDHRPELVPAWALQITLHPGEFESMSVY